MGSDGELSEFIQREHPRLVGALTAHCGDRGAAEDIAQEALARVCARWSQVRQMRAPAAWLHRVAFNLASSTFRRRAAELRANGRHGLGAQADDSDLAGALAVRTALRRLPVKQRTALICRYYLGLSASETAEVMAIRPEAVRQHTARGVRALRARFVPVPQEEQGHV